MYFSSLLLLATLVPFTLSQANANTNATNGIGSSPADRHYITLEQARSVIAAGQKKAASVVPSNIAVVDLSGQLVAFERGDNAFLASIDIAIKKARTVVLFNGAPSGSFQPRAQTGGDLFAVEETNGGLVVFGGGFPLYDKTGHLIGAVGSSGGTVPQDETVATAAVAGLWPNPA